MPESKVLELAHALVEAGCREVGLSDTTGYANPAQIRRLVRRVKSEIGEEKLTGVHLHNTRGLGLANAMAALEEGITTLDSSLGGIGGCPFAPGASGNIVTEDLVFMLESMGLNTGIDLDRLLKVRDVVNEALPSTEMYGFTPEAGLPLGFHPGWGHSLEVFLLPHPVRSVGGRTAAAEPHGWVHASPHRMGERKDGGLGWPNATRAGLREFG